jgi:hypothetical protein
MANGKNELLIPGCWLLAKKPWVSDNKRLQQSGFARSQ